jgi:general secretion pathway protein G
MPNEGNALPTMDRVVRNAERGMTLIEIMVVLTLISLIGATLGIAVTKKLNDAKVKDAQIQVRQLSGEVQQFMIAKNRCPTVEELVAERYVRRAPVDPWGKPIEITCPGQHDPDGVDIVSTGKDGQQGTDDDVESWKL